MGSPDIDGDAHVEPAPGWLDEIPDLKAHGIPLPEHYSSDGYLTVEENARLQLQAVRLGEVLLGSCGCEAQVDLILNFESRADTAEGVYDGFAWDEHCDPQADGSWACPQTRRPRSPR